MKRADFYLGAPKTYAKDNAYRVKIARKLTTLKEISLGKGRPVLMIHKGLKEAS